MHNSLNVTQAVVWQVWNALSDRNRPRYALWLLKSCQLLHNCMKNPNWKGLK